LLQTLGATNVGPLRGQVFHGDKRVYLQTLGLSEARYFMGWLTNISKNLLTQRSMIWAGIYPFFYEFKLRPRRGPTFVAKGIPLDPGLGEAQRL